MWVPLMATAFLLPRTRHLAVHPVKWIIAHPPHPAVAEEELLLLLQVQRPGADAAEDGDGVAALVDGAVAVEGAADGEGVAAVGDAVGGDEVRGRAGAEALVAGGVGGRELDD